MKKKINKRQATFRPHLFLGNRLTKKGTLQEVWEVCLTPGTLLKLFTATAEPAPLLNLELPLARHRYRNTKAFKTTLLLFCFWIQARTKCKLIPIHTHHVIHLYYTSWRWSYLMPITGLLWYPQCCWLLPHGRQSSQSHCLYVQMLQNSQTRQ